MTDEQLKDILVDLRGKTIAFADFGSAFSANPILNLAFTDGSNLILDKDSFELVETQDFEG